VVGARAASNAKATAPAACDPSYPDFCIPAGQQELDCDQVGRANFKVLPPDPYGFDEGDGIGCVDESLGKDAVVPPTTGAATAATSPPAASAPAPQPRTTAVSPAPATGTASSANSTSALGKTGLSVARQAATAALLMMLGYVFTSWARRSAESPPL
jgi:hypothetical protein